jgi:hypothetical protein
MSGSVLGAACLASALPTAGKAEAAAGRLAADRDVAIHQLHDVLADAQPKAGAAIAACGGTVGLGEGLENAVLLGCAHADAGVADGKVQRHLVLVFPSSRTLSVTSPESVNLTALPTRLFSTCPRRSGSPISWAGPRCRCRTAVPVPCHAPAAPSGRPPGNDFFQRELGLLAAELAGFDLGEIQNVVDQAKQPVGCGMTLSR